MVFITLPTPARPSRSWTPCRKPIRSGLENPRPEKKYPALFLAGKAGSRQALFRSDDAGASWTRINDDQHQFGSIGQVLGDPRIYGRVYFATGGRGIIYGDLKPNPK